MRPEDRLSRYVEVDVSPARVGRIWSGVSERVATQSKRSRLSLGLALGGSLAAAAAALALFLSRPEEPVATAPQATSLSSAALETASDTLAVDLPDGSRIELAAHTRARLKEEQGQVVRVELLRGAVECDLVPRADRHFSVVARDVEVRVTGTRFSVRAPADDSAVEVAVERGSVEVHRLDRVDESPRRLTAGERFTADLTESEPPAATAEPATSSEPPDEAVPSARPNPRPKPAPAPKKLEPEPDAKALLDSANAARRAGDAVGAAKSYQTLLTRFPSDGRAGLAAFELGRLRMDRLGDLPGAVSALRQAVAQAPGSSFREDAMARLVRAYSAMGNSKACQTARARYLSSYPAGVHAATLQSACP